MTRTLPALLSAFALAGCAALQPAPPALPLLSPASLAAPHSAQQLVSAAAGPAELVMQCALDADADHVQLVALTPMGQRIVTLNWNGRDLSAEASEFAPKQFDPHQLLSDVQLVLWPLTAWQAALANSDWSVTEPAAGLRRLRYRGRMIEEIHYTGADPWLGRQWLVNFPLGYSLDIQSAAP